jgi:hypothetical protein
MAEPTRHVFPGKKYLDSFFLFFFFPFNKKIEHQSELNSMTSWTLSLWKVSLCPAVVKKVSVIVCLEKSGMPSLPCGWFQNCLSKPADSTGEQHATHTTPLPTPPQGNIIQHSPWAD